MKSKILMLVQNEIKNDPRVYKTAFTIDSLGHEVIVLCISDEGNEKEEIDNIKVERVRRKKISKKVKLKNRSVQISDQFIIKKEKVFRINDLKFLLKLLFTNFQLILAGKKYKSSIYFANDLDTLLAATVLSKLNRGKLIYDSHELYNEQFINTSIFLKKSLEIIERSLIKKSDVVITVNDSIAEVLSNRYTIPLPTTLLNCPNYKKLAKQEKQEVRNYAKLVYLGKYIPGRGLEEIIQSMKYVENAVLFLRGFGDLESKLIKIVEEEKLENKVKFLEPVPMTEIVKSLADFDIGIVPYKPVSLNNKLATPNKIFEYMMAGLAISSSDIPELRKIVLSNDLGTVFYPDSIESISNAINKMTQNKSELEKMKNNSKKRSKEIYNWEVQSKKLVHIFNELLGGDSDAS